MAITFQRCRWLDYDRYLLASYIPIAWYIVFGTVGDFRCADWKHIPSLKDEQEAIELIGICDNDGINSTYAW